MSTLLFLKPKELLKDLDPVLYPTLATLLSYSMIGHEEERLYKEDQNMFIVAFLEDTED
jgi:hypothetical protein